MWEVLDTAEHVARESCLVKIDEQALNRFARQVRGDDVKVPPWNPIYHFRGSDEETVSFLLVLDSVNFCFWPPPGKARWEIEYQSNKLSGYYGLAAALKKAAESGVPIIEADYLATLTIDQLAGILGKKGELPLMEKRSEILNELGHILQREFRGKALKLVEGAGRSALALVRMLVEKLASFRDVAQYQSRKVFFYKRAQIFAADLYGAFDGRSWGDFNDIDKLTAFADYKVPQVLRHLGIFSYSRSLAKKVDQQTHLDAGSPEEVEIRANTIWAVELIRRELKQMGKYLRAFEIDWILWNLGQQAEFRTKPYHRTLTIFY